MVSITDLLTAGPGVPPVASNGGAAKAQKGAGLMGLVNTIGEIQDPMARELVRGTFNNMFRQVPGFEGFELPDPEELTLRTESRAAQLKQVRLSNSNSNMALAESAYVDADPALKKKYGLDPNDLWAKGVGPALAFINSEGLSPEKLTKGQVALAFSDRYGVAPMDPDQILAGVQEQAAAKEQQAAIKGEQAAYDYSQLPAKREAEQIGRAQQEASDLTQLNKVTAETVAGKGGLSDFVTRMGQGAEEGEWDEPEGSRALLLSAAQGLDEAPVAVRAILAKAFLQQHKSWLKGNLGNVPRDQAGKLVGGAAGKMLGGLGPEDVTPEASGNLAILMHMFDKALGGEGAAFREIEMPEVRGVNLDAFGEMVNKLGQQAGGQ